MSVGDHVDDTIWRVEEIDLTCFDANSSSDFKIEYNPTL